MATPLQVPQQTVFPQAPDVRPVVQEDPVVQETPLRFPDYRVGVGRTGIDWASIGSNAASTAAALYEQSLKYLAETKSNKITDLYEQQDLKLTELRNRMAANPAAYANPNKVRQEVEEIRKQFREGSSSLLGQTWDQKYLMSDEPEKNIFSPQHDIGQYGEIYQNIYLRARGADRDIAAKADDLYWDSFYQASKEVDVSVDVQQWYEGIRNYSDLPTEAQKRITMAPFDGRTDLPVQVLEDNPRFAQRLNEEGKWEPVVGPDGSPVLVPSGTDSKGNQLFKINPGAFSALSDEDLRTLVPHMAYMLTSVHGESIAPDLMDAVVRAVRNPLSNTGMSYAALGVISTLPPTVRAQFDKGLSVSEQAKLRMTTTAFKMGASRNRIAQMLSFDSDTVSQANAFVNRMAKPSVYNGNEWQMGFSEIGDQQIQELVGPILAGMYQTLDPSATDVSEFYDFVPHNMGNYYFATDPTPAKSMASLLFQSPVLKDVALEVTTAAYHAIQSGILTGDSGQLDPEKALKWSNDMFQSLQASGKMVAVPTESGGHIVNNPALAPLVNDVAGTTVLSQNNLPATPENRYKLLNSGFKGTLASESFPNTEAMLVAARSIVQDVDPEYLQGVLSQVSVLRKATNGTTISGPLPKAETLKAAIASSPRVQKAYYATRIAPIGSSQVLTDDQRDAAFAGLMKDLPPANYWDWASISDDRGINYVTDPWFGGIPFGLKSIKLKDGFDLIDSGWVTIQQVEGLAIPGSQADPEVPLFAYRGVQNNGQYDPMGTRQALQLQLSLEPIADSEDTPKSEWSRAYQEVIGGKNPEEIPGLPPPVSPPYRIVPNTQEIPDQKEVTFTEALTQVLNEPTMFPDSLAKGGNDSFFETQEDFAGWMKSQIYSGQLDQWAEDHGMHFRHSATMAAYNKESLVNNLNKLWKEINVPQYSWMDKKELAMFLSAKAAEKMTFNSKNLDWGKMPLTIREDTLVGSDGSLIYQSNHPNYPEYLQSLVDSGMKLYTDPQQPNAGIIGAAAEVPQGMVQVDSQAAIKAATRTKRINEAMIGSTNQEEPITPQTIPLPLKWQEDQFLKEYAQFARKYDNVNPDPNDPTHLFNFRAAWVDRKLNGDVFNNPAYMTKGNPRRYSKLLDGSYLDLATKGTITSDEYKANMKAAADIKVRTNSPYRLSYISSREYQAIREKMPVYQKPRKADLVQAQNADEIIKGQKTIYVDRLDGVVGGGLYDHPVRVLQALERAGVRVTNPRWIVEHGYNQMLVDTASGGTKRVIFFTNGRIKLID